MSEEQRQETPEEETLLEGVMRELATREFDGKPYVEAHAPDIIRWFLRHYLGEHFREEEVGR